MSLVQALFIVFGALIAVSSLMVILHRSAVSSALFLVLAFVSLGALYLTLGAEFIGMVQIIVYAGAIMVLFLFVIMYLNLEHDVESGVRIAMRRGFGWLLGLLVLGLAGLLAQRGWSPGPVSTAPAPMVGNTQQIGLVLYSRYLFPFEITSMVLLVAMVGAIVMSRGRRADRGGAATPPEGGAS
jgi:NADH-quinone oxidoreductase subunit J